jgi:hypothetical protein
MRRISVYRQGSWRFTTFSTDQIVFVDDTNSYVKVSEMFGLSRTNQNDPAKPEVRGRAGDYIVVDDLGSLALMKQEDFDALFPPPIEGVSRPKNSDTFMSEKYMGPSSENTNKSNSNMTSNSSTSTGGTTNARSTTTRTSY